jgi:hypothetical protein
MREPLRPVVRFVQLALGALALACSGDALIPQPVTECAASNEAVDAYLSRIAGIASNHASDGILARHESATISFALAADGSASDFRVEKARRPAAGAEVLRAAAAASPYPRPPFDPKACLVGGRAKIGLIGHARCDETRQDAYIEAVSTRILRAVTKAQVTATQREKISLRMKIDRQGAPSIAVQDAQTPELGERVAALARSLAPYEAPDDAIAECVSDLAFFVWIELPGTTRPPIRIR